jgi:hypothetical protein
VIALAGIFWSVEDIGYGGGGKRPPFISGGVAPDMMREMVGSSIIAGKWKSNSNILFTSYITDWADSIPARVANPDGDIKDIRFDNRTAVSTGPQNAPVTASIRIWRRI